RIVLAQNFGPAPGTSVYDQAGLLVAIYDGSGEREVLEGMRITEVENAGQGIPATATPYVWDVVGLADGSFAVIGDWQYIRQIECGSQDDPRPPEYTICSDGRGQG